VASESLDVWKDYLRAHLIEHYAAVLPKAVATEHAAFLRGGPGPRRRRHQRRAQHAVGPALHAPLVSRRRTRAGEGHGR